MTMFIMTTVLFAGMLYNVYWITVSFSETFDSDFSLWDSAVVFNTIQAIAFTVNVSPLVATLSELAS